MSRSSRTRAAAPCRWLLVAGLAAAPLQAQSRCTAWADTVVASLPTDRDAALALVRALTAQCRNDYDALFRAGRAINRAASYEQDRGDLPLREAAVKLLDRAARLRRNNAAAWFEFGVAIKKRGGLQIDAFRAINRALELADRFPDSTPPVLLAEIELQRARYLQDWIDRFRRLKNGAKLAVSTPACSNLGLFCENYTRPAEFNERLATAPDAVPDVGGEREELIARFEKILRLDPANAEAVERYGRELALEEEWEPLRDLARRAQRRGVEPGLFRAVEGLAAWKRNRPYQADSCFSEALARLPDGPRRWLERPPVGLDTIADFWARSRPLWLAPYNELLLEYRARATYAMLVFQDREAEVLGPETPLGEVLIRYGWPRRWVQLERDPLTTTSPSQMAEAISSALDCLPDPIGGTGDGYTTHGGMPTCGTPSLGAGTSGTDYTSGRWIVWTYDPAAPSLMFEHRAAMRVQRFVWDSRAEDHFAIIRAQTPMTFQSRLAPTTLALPVQVARLQGTRPGSTDAWFFGLIPTPQLGVPLGDSLDTGLFVFRDTAGFPSVVARRGRHLAGANLLLDTHVPLSAGHYSYSLEALAASGSAAARARDSLIAPAWSPDSLAVSDIVLAHGVTPVGDSAPVRWDDLRVDASRTLAILPGGTAWAVWEIYGLARSPQGTGRYAVALVLRDARARPWPLRLLERLGVGRDERVAVRLEWRSERPLAADGRTVEYVAVQLPADAAGEYVLDVTITDGQGRTATRSRNLTIVRQADQ